MDLKMEVYSPGLELLGVLEIQRSIIWEEKAFSAGSFSLESLITDESRALLTPENIIWIEGETAGIIEYVQRVAREDGPYITIKGRTLAGILDRRILWGTYNLYGTAPAIMRRLVDDCAINPTRGDTEARKIPGLVALDAPSGGEAIRKQQTGGTLLEALEEIGEANGVAFGVRFNPAYPRMEFWTRWGQDRSVNQDNHEPVFYSTELDDVLSSEYSYNSTDYRNVTLVAGEGEGADRVYTTVMEQVPETPVIPPEPAAKYTVTLSVTPEGGGTVTGAGEYEEGKQATVTATPNGGYRFVRWIEAGSIYTVNISISGYSAALFNALTLTVSGESITSSTATVQSGNPNVDIKCEITKKISVARSVSVNGIDIGHIQSLGDTVQTTVSITDGATIEIDFTNYSG